MSADDRERWDNRYRAGAYADRPHPTRLLEAHAHQLPPGRALDVACGAGRNAIFLAGLGFEVDAVDISTAAIERARETAAAASVDVNFVAADLTNGLPADLDGERRYALIVLVRYVNLALTERLCDSVAAGGWYFCEQHLQTDLDVAGPRSAGHRLAHGELAAATAALDLRFYREGIVADPDGRRVALAQAIVTRGGTRELDYC